MIYLVEECGLTITSPILKPQPYLNPPLLRKIFPSFVSLSLCDLASDRVRVGGGKARTVFSFIITMKID